MAKKKKKKSKEGEKGVEEKEDTTPSWQSI